MKNIYGGKCQLSKPLWWNFQGYSMTLWHSSRAVPPLPGAQKTCRTLGDSLNFTAMACSRPPPPTTKTSMAAKRLETIGIPVSRLMAIGKQNAHTKNIPHNGCSERQKTWVFQKFPYVSMFLNPPQETCSKECPTSSQPRQWCFPVHVRSRSHPPDEPRSYTCWTWRFTCFNTMW